MRTLPAMDAVVWPDAEEVNDEFGERFLCVVM
jgi:hypothetical protein